MFMVEVDGQSRKYYFTRAAAIRARAALRRAYNTLDAWAERLGVDPDNFIIEAPEYVEQWQLAVQKTLAKWGKRQKFLFVLDSVAGSPLKREFDAEGLDEKEVPGEMSRVWSRFLRNIVGPLGNSQSAILLLNQVRTKIGVMYGDPETIPGGRALGFYSSIIVKVSHGKGIKNGEVIVGKGMNLCARKNKCAPPMRRGEVRLNFETGFDDEWSTLNHAREMQVVDAKCRSLEEARAGLNWPGPMIEKTGTSDGT